MNILMVSFDGTIAASPSGSAAGSRTRHIRYARGLAQRTNGGTLTVLVPRLPDRKQDTHEEGPLRVVPMGSRRPAFLADVGCVGNRFLAQDTIDLITTQSPFDDALVARGLAARHGLPLNVQMHSSFLDMEAWIGGRPLTRRVLNRIGRSNATAAATIRVVSYGERERLKRLRFGREIDAKVHVLPALIDRETYLQPAPAAAAVAVRDYLASREIRAEAPVVLFAGRLAPEKNIPLLLHAMRLVREAVPEAVLMVAGDGPARRGMASLAGRVVPSGTVRWLGALEAPILRAWYQRAGLLVLPSFYEGYGRVVVEAALAATPAVVTPFVSAPELVLDRRSGAIARGFEDAAELASLIVPYLQDREMSRRHGEQARRHMDAYLPTDEEYLDRLVGIWRTTAGSGGA